MDLNNTGSNDSGMKIGQFNSLYDSLQDELDSLDERKNVVIKKLRELEKMRECSSCYLLFKDTEDEFIEEWICPKCSEEN